MFNRTTVKHILSGIILVSLFATLSGTPGCTTSREVKVEGKTPEQLGVIGARVYRSPSNAEAILDNNNMTREQFEQAVREVTTETHLAHRYREAFERELEQSEQ
jgi:hypothetical protein